MQPNNSRSSSAIKVLQVNLNHCWAAQQLLLQTIAERGIDVVIVSDYNRHMGASPLQWVTSTDGKCAIYVTSRSPVGILDQGSGVGFAWARIGSTRFYSCYFTPNCSLQDFDRYLGDLEASIRNQGGAGMDTIVAGDFNSHSTEWGSATDDNRGRLLSDFAASLGLGVCNVGSTPTFRRANATSVIDITFSRSAGNRPLVSDWSVMTECYTASDHEYIGYSVTKAAVLGPVVEHKVTHHTGWSTKKLSLEAIKAHWDRADTPPPLSANASAEEHSDRLQDFLTRACDAAMPSRSVFHGKRAAHWWNEGIASLRRAAIAARRTYQRAGRKGDVPGRVAASEAYSLARKELKLAIRRAQERSWRELCNSVESDPWGAPYRIVTKRLGRRTPAIDGQTMVRIAGGLFPGLPPIEWSLVPATPSASTELIEFPGVETPLFTADELLRAADKLPSGKAPGPDCVPNEVIRLAVSRSPDTFLTAFNACLVKRVFPIRWKRAKLVLLHKGSGKPPDQPSSYRPISLLDGAGKLLERMLLNRITPYVEGTGAISDFQFGFRRSRSTTDAIREVLRIARAAGDGAVQNRHLCTVVTLDVKNAFNTAPWTLIDAALHRAGVPGYLTGILRSYMSEREILIGTVSSQPVTCGVPQGSVLGPTLWNLFYDGVLRLPVRDGVKLVAFADDLAVVAVAHNAELMEQLVNPTLEDIARWMTSNGLRLAPEKSECVVLTNKHSYRAPALFVQGCQIPVKKAIRYLGVQLDTRLSFVEHATTAAAAARKTAVAIGRLMPNVGGPSQAKRQLLMGVVHSKLLFGADVWAERVLGVQKPKTLLLQSQRCAALRVARCYRTVSDMASLVLARTPPVFLLAVGRSRIATAKRTGVALSKGEVMADVVRRWQDVWESTTKATWTRRLIPDVSRWWQHGLRQVSYHLAQALTGHGCFQQYLWSRGRARSPACVHCSAAVDDAEHTIFLCPFWDGERSVLLRYLGRPARPEDVIDLLCGPEPAELPPGQQRERIMTTASRHRSAFLEMIEKILSRKEDLERARQRVEATGQAAS